MASKTSSGTFTWADLPPEDKALHDLVGTSYPLEEALRLRGLVKDDGDEAILDPNTVDYLAEEDDDDDTQGAAAEVTQGPKAKKVSLDEGQVREMAEECAVAMRDPRVELYVDVVSLLGLATARATLDDAAAGDASFLDRAKQLLPEDWPSLFSQEAKRRREQRKRDHFVPPGTKVPDDEPSEWATDHHHLLHILRGDQPPSFDPPGDSIAARLYR